MKPKLPQLNSSLGSPIKNCHGCSIIEKEWWSWRRHTKEINYWVCHMTEGEQFQRVRIMMTMSYLLFLIILWHMALSAFPFALFIETIIHIPLVLSLQEVHTTTHAWESPAAATESLRPHGHPFPSNSQAGCHSC